MGGSSNVPLGFLSLTENLMMIAMAVGMGLAAIGLAGGAHVFPHSYATQALPSIAAYRLLVRI